MGSTMGCGASVAAETHDKHSRCETSEPTCPSGHKLKRQVACDNCCDGGCGREVILPPECIFRCEVCDFDMCSACYSTKAAGPGPTLLCLNGNAPDNKLEDNKAMT